MSDGRDFKTVVVDHEIAVHIESHFRIAAAVERQLGKSQCPACRKRGIYGNCTGHVHDPVDRGVGTDRLHRKFYDVTALYVNFGNSDDIAAFVGYFRIIGLSEFDKIRENDTHVIQYDIEVFHLYEILACHRKPQH